MLATSATRPARFSDTIRRVRLEKLSAKKNCPALRSQPSGRCQPCAGGFSKLAPSSTRDDEASSALRLESGCVRSSNGQTAGCFGFSLSMRAAFASYPRQMGTFVTKTRPRAPKSDFLEAIAHSVQGLYHFEIVVHDLEFLAQPLDVAVDGAIVDIDLVVIGRVHQGVAAFHDAGARGQRLQDQKFRDRQRHRLVLPSAGVSLRVHAQEPAVQRLGIGFL